MATIVFTGFPGFLGVELLPRVLRAAPDEVARCVVQPRHAGLAAQRRDELVAADGSLAGRIDLVEGDITKKGLGVDDVAALTADTVEIWHLAAVYDLHVRREVGMAVNVEGTRNVLDLAADCASLRRLQYVSTCYVAGRHPGVFTEDDLDVGQSFGNFYEETKFLAELDVRARMGDGLPATVYRPAIVVGDSGTGATQKYDGPYYMIRLILRQPTRYSLVPTVGDPNATELNLVPRDAVIDGIAALAGRDDTVGATFQLADPTPPTITEVVDALERATGKRLVRVRLPQRLARTAIERVPGVERLLQVPPELVDYLTLPTKFRSAKTQAALAGTGARIPSFPEYADVIVAFVRQHPEISSAAMV